MKTTSKYRPAIRRSIIGTTLGMLLAAVLGIVSAPPASAGSNGNMWIGANAGRVSVQQFAGVNGTYHIDVWYWATGAWYGGTVTTSTAAVPGRS